MASIERATTADFAELVELRLAYLDADFGELPAEQKAQIVPEVERYLPEHLDRDLHIFLAREEGKIACCVWLLTVEKPPSPRFPHGRTGILFNFRKSPLSRFPAIRELQKGVPCLLQSFPNLHQHRLEITAQKITYIIPFRLQVFALSAAYFELLYSLLVILPHRIHLFLLVRGLQQMKCAFPVHQFFLKGS